MSLMTVRAEGKRWIQCLEARPRARMRLFCFSFAGGGAGVFRRWPRYLARSIEVHAIQLPGRENRFGEPCAQSMDEVVAAVMGEWEALSDVPAAFFGHSLGALTAYEVAAAVERSGLGEPCHLIVSGRRAAHQNRTGNFHNLPEDALIGELIRLNGTSPQIFADREMRDLFLPMLRSDYRILETYRHAQRGPLDLPIAACSGADDSEVSPAEMLAWRELTRGLFQYLPFPGDHFYLNPHVQSLVEAVSTLLSRKTN